MILKPYGLALLREPFPDHQVSLLPRPIKKDDQEKFKCERGTRASADGIYCGGYHARSIHLSYVGHAALTDRLLDCDQMWNWDPLSTDEHGLPRLQNGLLWIKLTVCGMTRIGVGDAAAKGSNKSDGDLMKERIGDALRNAALRFGAALEFWHEGVLHVDAEGDLQESEPPGAPDGAPAASVDYYPAERFETNIDKWRGLIHSGRKTADEVIRQVESSGFALTDDQKEAIRGKAAS